MSQLVSSRSWDSIESHFVDLNSQGWHQEELLALVQHIKGTSLAQRVFAVTSLDELVISKYTPFAIHHEVVRVRYDRSQQAFLFNYLLEQLPEPEVQRKYPAELGIEKFNLFMRWLNW
ncbi:hypothetical protein [Hymenobacter sp. BRD67]|uniref:hypothetical protein n=1 Tax=Hymenobacter sp. BRD67 TaxID=2675877 RepID=UPI001565F4EE|nr:hypothetical protein [Hymenobacter sp. BRD67]QKG53627.1 hypothetical protein GKZ67_14740 [Hymenobacter sp. BRD67]